MNESFDFAKIKELLPKKDVYIDGNFVQTIYGQFLCVTPKPPFCKNPRRFEQFPIELYQPNKLYAAIEFIPLNQSTKEALTDSTFFGDFSKVIKLGLNCLINLINDDRFGSINYFIGDTNKTMARAAHKIGFVAFPKDLIQFYISRTDLSSKQSIIEKQLIRADSLGSLSGRHRIKLLGKTIHL